MGSTFYIEHLGCAKNRVDAEIMTQELVGSGWVPVSDPDAAQVIMVNSCGFIEPAKRESIDTLLSLRKRFPDKRIILTGCLAERYGAELVNSFHEADAVFGNRELSRIVDHVDHDRIRHVEPPRDGGLASTARPREAAVVDGAGYLRIAEGCDNRCAFCAIPLIRGPLRSRSIETVVADAETMVGDGVYEINLVAQDIASYGRDLETPSTGETPSLVGLIRRILEVPGDFMLRMLYMHPDHFDPELLDLVGRDERLLPYFDLPFQHASPRILSAMGRSGSSETYLELLDTIRRVVPDAVIRSTFLVGFPGEGAEDRRELLRFQQEARIDWLGVFTYSHEEGTRAYRLGRPGRRARRRAEELRREIEEAQIPITGSQMDRFVGRELSVLIEEPIAGTGFAVGRGYPHAPEVDGNIVVHGEALEASTMARCRIFKRNGIDLEGTIVE